jgi:hypothetical protein
MMMIIEIGKTYVTASGFLFEVVSMENGFAFDTQGYPCPLHRLRPVSMKS